MEEINVLKKILISKEASNEIPYQLLQDDQPTDSISNATHLVFNDNKYDLEQLIYPLKETGDDPKHSMKTLLFLLSQEWEGFGGYLTQCLTNGISSLGLLEFQPTLEYFKSLKDQPIESHAVPDEPNQKKFKSATDALNPADQFLNTILRNELTLPLPDNVNEFKGSQSYQWVVELIDKTSQRPPSSPESDDEPDHKVGSTTPEALNTSSTDPSKLPIILLSSNSNALVKLNNVVSFLTTGNLLSNDSPSNTSIVSSPLIANLTHPSTQQTQQYRIISMDDWHPANPKEEQKVRLLLTCIFDDVMELGWKGKYPCVIVYDKFQDRPHFWHGLATDEEIFKLEVDHDDNLDQLRMMWEFEKVKI